MAENKRTCALKAYGRCLTQRRVMEATLSKTTLEEGIGKWAHIGK